MTVDLTFKVLISECPGGERSFLLRVEFQQMPLQLAARVVRVLPVESLRRHVVAAAAHASEVRLAGLWNRQGK